MGAAWKSADAHMEKCAIGLTKSQDPEVMSLVDPSGVHLRPSEVTWTTDLPTTQALAASYAYGVATQKKLANVARVYGNSEDGVIMCATRGTCEITLQTAATVINGVTTFTFAKNPASNLLIDSDYVVTTNANQTVFVAVESKVNATRVYVRLKTPNRV